MALYQQALAVHTFMPRSSDGASLGVNLVDQIISWQSVSLRQSANLAAAQPAR